MGATRSNMPSMKVMVSVAILLAISLHTTDGQACQIPSEVVITSSVVNTVYNVLGAANTNCGTACPACGQTVAAAVDTVQTNFATQAQVDLVANAICPTITYSNLVAVDGANNLAGLGIGVPATVQTFTANGAAGGLGVAIATANTNLRTDREATLGQLVSNGRRTTGAADIAVNPGASTGIGFICPCLMAAATVNTCAICGCNNLGVPSAAPTAIPTTAPTAATGAPTSGSNALFSSSDDSLSGGAIAGIVIGSVVGAALVIGAGVMIGSK